MNKAAVLQALLFLLTVLPSALSIGESSPSVREPVVVLHGLARSTMSMSKMVESLEEAGYEVCNVAYPSREYTIEVLSVDFVAPAIAHCFPERKQPLHFVTHSLGGIIVRQLAASGAISNVGRVVMLSPPNQGSEIVDKLGGWWLFKIINGPAGEELGTGEEALPRRLGPAPFELGIITGNRSINPILSTLIPGVDDGKVSLTNAKLSSMKDFLVVPSSHPFIMKNADAIKQTIYFLKHGTFLHATPLQQVSVDSVARR